MHRPGATVIWFLLKLTLRQQVLRKSTLLLVGLACLPVLVAVIYRLADSTTDPRTWTSENLYGGLIVTVVLPLTALMFGTSVIGDDLEDGTAIYLLTKPIPRWQILLPKLIAPWLLTSVILVASTVVSGVIAIDSGSRDVVYGAAFAMILGSAVYIAIFVMLSVASSHTAVLPSGSITWAGLLIPGKIPHESDVVPIHANWRTALVRFRPPGRVGHTGEASAQGWVRSNFMNDRRWLVSS